MKTIQCIDAFPAVLLPNPLCSVAIIYSQFYFVHIKPACHKTLFVLAKLSDIFKAGICNLVIQHSALTGFGLESLHPIVCMPTFISFAVPYFSRDSPWNLSHIPSVSSYRSFVTRAPAPLWRCASSMCRIVSAAWDSLSTMGYSVPVQVSFTDGACRYIQTGSKTTAGKAHMISMPYVLRPVIEKVRSGQMDQYPKKQS